ncbi:hypothetical protein [Epibacterium ulvae]|nr:hypothetical protein [Epibacterium ulvae]
MTHKIAVWLGLTLIVAAGVDWLMFGPEHLIFLGKKIFELIHWVAFWR